MTVEQRRSSLQIEPSATSQLLLLDTPSGSGLSSPGARADEGPPPRQDLSLPHSALRPRGRSKGHAGRSSKKPRYLHLGDELHSNEESQRRSKSKSRSKSRDRHRHRTRPKSPVADRTTAKRRSKSRKRKKMAVDGGETGSRSGSSSSSSRSSSRSGSTSGSKRKKGGKMKDERRRHSYRMDGEIDAKGTGRVSRHLRSPLRSSSMSPTAKERKKEDMGIPLRVCGIKLPPPPPRLQKRHSYSAGGTSAGPSSSSSMMIKESGMNDDDSLPGSIPLMRAQSALDVRDVKDSGKRSKLKTPVKGGVRVKEYPRRSLNLPSKNGSVSPKDSADINALLRMRGKSVTAASSSSFSKKTMTKIQRDGSPIDGSMSSPSSSSDINDDHKSKKESHRERPAVIRRRNPPRLSPGSSDATLSDIDDDSADSSDGSWGYGVITSPKRRNILHPSPMSLRRLGSSSSSSKSARISHSVSVSGDSTPQPSDPRSTSSSIVIGRGSRRMRRLSRGSKSHAFSTVATTKTSLTKTMIPCVTLSAVFVGEGSDVKNAQRKRSGSMASSSTKTAPAAVKGGRFHLALCLAVCDVLSGMICDDSLPKPQVGYVLEHTVVLMCQPITKAIDDSSATIDWTGLCASCAAALSVRFAYHHRGHSHSRRKESSMMIDESVSSELSSSEIGIVSGGVGSIAPSVPNCVYFSGQVSTADSMAECTDYLISMQDITAGTLVKGRGSLSTMDPMSSSSDTHDSRFDHPISFDFSGDGDPSSLPSSLAQTPSVLQSESLAKKSSTMTDISGDSKETSHGSMKITVTAPTGHSSGHKSLSLSAASKYGAQRSRFLGSFMPVDFLIDQSDTRQLLFEHGWPEHLRKKMKEFGTHVDRKYFGWIDPGRVTHLLGCID